MTSISIEEQRQEHAASLTRNLEKLTAALSADLRVQRVILFGSYLAGRRDLFTDLDVIVVMDSEQDFITRTGKLYLQLDLDVALDLLVYTPEEFEVMKHKIFLNHALKNSEVLYERG